VRSLNGFVSWFKAGNTGFAFSRMRGRVKVATVPCVCATVQNRALRACSMHLTHLFCLIIYLSPNRIEAVDRFFLIPRSLHFIVLYGVSLSRGSQSASYHPNRIEAVDRFHVTMKNSSVLVTPTFPQREVLKLTLPFSLCRPRLHL
jgi:hypothetical protein